MDQLNVPIAMEVAEDSLMLAPPAMELDIQCSEGRWVTEEEWAMEVELKPALRDVTTVVETGVISPMSVQRAEDQGVCWQLNLQDPAPTVVEVVNGLPICAQLVMEADGHVRCPE